MSVKITGSWKKGSAQEILDDALPDQLLITEINPDLGESDGKQAGNPGARG